MLANTASHLVCLWHQKQLVTYAITYEYLQKLSYEINDEIPSSAGLRSRSHKLTKPALN